MSNRKGIRLGDADKPFLFSDLEPACGDHLDFDEYERHREFQKRFSGDCRRSDRRHNGQDMINWRP